MSDPLVIIELALRIVLLAMEGQTPEQRAKMWERHFEMLERWDKFWGIGQPTEKV